MDSKSVRLMPQRRALVDDVYDAVLGLLMDQVIEPGARANIDAIAKKLDVSPTPVREALTRLESEGLVAKQAQRGYTAAPLLDEQRLSDLYDLRMLLEPVAAGRAAASISDDTLAGLERLTEAMHVSAKASRRGGNRYNDYKSFAEQDAAFHAAILACGGNQLIGETVARLHPHLHLYRLYYKHGIATEASDEHDAVLRALAAHDGQGARVAMRNHLKASLARLAGQVAAHEARASRTR